jgi:hypothetical protein
MHAEASEILEISQGVKDFAVQLMLQIDVTLGIVGEPKVNHEIVNIFGFNYFWNHDSTTPLQVAEPVWGICHPQ